MIHTMLARRMKRFAASPPHAGSSVISGMIGPDVTATIRNAAMANGMPTKLVASRAQAACHPSPVTEPANTNQSKFRNNHIAPDGADANEPARENVSLASPAHKRVLKTWADQCTERRSTIGETVPVFNRVPLPRNASLTTHPSSFPRRNTSRLTTRCTTTSP